MPTQHKHTFVSLCAKLEVLLVTYKLEGFSTSLSFLGIIYTLTTERYVRLPSDKLATIQELMTSGLPRKMQE